MQTEIEAIGEAIDFLAGRLIKHGLYTDQCATLAAKAREVLGRPEPRPTHGVGPFYDELPGGMGEPARSTTP